MDQDTDGALVTIRTLPAEMMGRILAALRHGDFCRARSAHQCFRIHTADEVWRGRRVHHWLRLSPETACKAGRLDILTFLDARRRLPLRVHELLRLAVKHGHCAIVQFLASRHMRLTKEQADALPSLDALIDPHDITRAAVERGDVDMTRALYECWGPPFCARDAISLALRADKTDMACRLMSEASTEDADVAVVLYGQALLIRCGGPDKTRLTKQMAALVASVSVHTVALTLLSIATDGIRPDPWSALPRDQDLASPVPPEASTTRRRERCAAAIRLIAATGPRKVVDAAVGIAATLKAHDAGRFLCQAVYGGASPTTSPAEQQ